MTKQIRYLPSYDRAHAVLDAIFAIETGDAKQIRRAEVTWEHSTQGRITERLYLVGIARNATGARSAHALIARKNEYTNVCEMIPVTALISISEVEAGQ